MCLSQGKVCYLYLFSCPFKFILILYISSLPFSTTSSVNLSHFLNRQVKFFSSNRVKSFSEKCTAGPTAVQNETVSIPNRWTVRKKILRHSFGHFYINKLFPYELLVNLSALIVKQVRTYYSTKYYTRKFKKIYRQRTLS